MELGLGNTLLAGDPRLVDHIVGEVKSQGIFDQFRKECIADVDTKPAYQNLRTRVESSVNTFLGKQTWKADLNKNQLRETLRKHIHEASYLDAGVERIVDQVVNPKVYSVFMPQIEDVVYKFLGLERPKNRERNGPCGFKDLLPKDLDPVSPESDKNSLKDVSLDSVDANINDRDAKDKDFVPTNEEGNEIPENESEKDNSINIQPKDEEKSTDASSKSCVASGNNSNLNNSAKSEDKGEEEEEDSPSFEPIDIMNLNESNISNDSHLSGISELTSHRSHSPDSSNEASRDNMDFSNQDSQFSKVSSDSRLSIVTDFGSSNHGSTPHSDALKDEKNDSKYAKDNFKAIREFESSKSREGRLSYESNASKENTDAKNLRRSLSSKETSRDGTETAAKDSRDSKEKSRDSETSKYKTKDRNEGQEVKKDKDRESRKKQNNRSEVKSEKSSKSKGKEKPEVVREVSDKTKDKDPSKPKEDKVKDTETKDGSVTKEGKDLKDIYKEKIRELREKKELTEKEKLSKDNKDIKLNKDPKEKRDSSRDKRDSKESKNSSSKTNNSTRPENKATKTFDKDSKYPKNDSKDKGKREERRYSKEHKPRTNETVEKPDSKRTSKTDDKTDVKLNTQKSVAKKDSRLDSHNKTAENKRDSKAEVDTKDKKRREEKKGKTKDDHSSLRKNSDDRRSTDRDGSNGSNGRSSQKSNSSSGTSSTKPVSSNLSKESTNTSNSSSETSDSIEELQHEKLKISIDPKNLDSIRNSRDNDLSLYLEGDSNAKKLDLGSNEISLPIKKRPLLNESNNPGDIYLKKPKFAKNFQEAKKLMKIRRKMEKRMLKAQLDIERNTESSSSAETLPIIVKNDVQSVPDDERVQIIEVRDEEYDEPYPEIKSDFTFEERSQIILGGESLFTSDLIAKQFNAKSKLSEMELSIRQSLKEMISDKIVDENSHLPKNAPDSTEMELDFKVKESLNTKEETLIPETVENETGTSRTLPKEILQSKDAQNIVKSNANRVEIIDKEDLDVPVDSEIRNKVPSKSEHWENTEKHSEIEEKNLELPEAEVEPKTEIIEIKEENIEDSDIEESANPIDESIFSSESSKTKIKSFVDSESTSVIKVPKIDNSSVQSSDDEEPCLYLIEDNERLEKFMKFMRILEANESLNAEETVEISVDKTESSTSKTMAPPQPKRKYSTSPLTDILLNSTNNNNDAHKITASMSDVEDTLNNIKKRKIGRPKKQISTTATPCSQQNLLNGENFVMPLSPESDVSATSEKTPSNPLKDEKSKPRGSNQRYTSDDLYKPRPLFSSSSRRSRRSNQA